MDGAKFDRVTRYLATGRSRRSVLRGLIGGGAAVLAARAATTLAAPEDKVTICHWSEDLGAYELISVSANALPAHEAHDLDIIDVEGACPCVPNCEGKTCGDDGCGGSCGTCGTNQVCTDDGDCLCAAPFVEQNGGCFEPCSDEGFPCGEGCSNCSCDPSTDDGTLLCRDYNVGVGPCFSNADCPSGSVCDPFILAGDLEHNLCTVPCLTCPA